MSETLTTDNNITGQLLKRDAVETSILKERAENNHRIYEAIKKRAESGLPFTSDDVRADLGEPFLATLHHPSVFAAQLSAAANSKPRLITKTGNYFPAKRKQSRGAVIAEWIGAKNA